MKSALKPNNNFFTTINHIIKMSHKIAIIEQEGKRYGIFLRSGNGIDDENESTDPDVPDNPVEPEPEEPSIPNYLLFGGDGGTQNLEIEHDGEWTLEQTGDWFTVSETSGEGNIEIDVTAGVNASGSGQGDDFVGQERYGSIVLHLSDGTSHTISVKQRFNIIFMCDRDSTKKIKVISNVNWVVLIGYNPNNIVTPIASGRGNKTITIGTDYSADRYLKIVSQEYNLTSAIFVIFKDLMPGAA
jgi:hypothetical protein